MSDARLNLFEQLQILRQSLIYALGGFLVIALPCLFFSNDLFELLARPLFQYHDGLNQLIATEVAAPFFVPIKLAMTLAFLLSLPLTAWLIWRYVAPGLYKHEKRYIWPLTLSSVSLFYAGTVFAFTLVLPIVFGFFAATTPDDVMVMTDMSSYLSFVLQLTLAFGFAFQIPVVLFALIRFGVVSRESIQAKRPYIIVGAFVIGMILTPPDVISQLMLAVPVWILFEVGLFCCRPAKTAL